MAKVFLRDPWRAVDCLREELRADAEQASMATLHTKCGIQFLPMADVVECAEYIEIVVELPGLSNEAVTLEVQDNELLICGERTRRQDESVATYHVVECSHGLFARRFAVPDEFDAHAARAHMKDGLLVVQVPRRMGGQPRNRRIAVSND